MDLDSALKDGHLVTVGALNKVYRYVLNELDKLNERTVDLYQVQGSVKSISDLYSITSANNGDVYNVIDPVDESGRGNTNYVCIRQYKIEDGNYLCQNYVKSSDDTPKPGVLYYKEENGSFTYVPTPVNPEEDSLYVKEYGQLKNSLDEDITIANIAENYSLIWDSLGGDISNATSDQLGLIKLSDEYKAGSNTYGLIKTGYEHTDASNEYSISLEPLTKEDGTANPNSGKAYATIPDASKDDKGVIQLGYSYNDGNYPVAIYESNAYVNVPVSAPLKYDTTASNDYPNGKGNIYLDYDTDLGLQVNDNGKLYNSGVVSISTGTANKFTFGVKVNNEETEVSVSDSDKIIYRNEYNNDSSSIGSSNTPVYIDGNTPKAIESLYLHSSNITPVASFAGGTAMTGYTHNAVQIAGGNVDENTELKPTSNAALFVLGGIVATSGITASKVYHAVWNDISDAIEVQDSLDVAPGFCYCFDGKEYHKTSKYCQKGVIGIHSDTAGDVLGKKGKHKELDIAIGGFVLAHVDKEYAPGTPLTCSKDGTLSKMKRRHVAKYPERLVGTYWKPELEEEWGTEDHKVQVCGRHWIKVK